MYVCGITPYDATHLGHAATMITFDLVQRLWRDAGHDVTLRAERHRHRRPAAGAGRPRRRGLDRPGHARDRPVPRGHGGAADHPAGALRRRGRVHPARSPRQVARPARRRRRRTGSTTAPATSTSTVAAAPRFGYESQPVPRARCWRSSAERGGDPERAGKRDPLDPLLWRGARDGEPAWDGGDARPRPPRLAHRVRRDRAAACSATRSTCRAAATTCSSRTTSAPPRTPRR